MTLAAMSDLMTSAWRAGRGVGAFNVVQIEHAEAFVAAAERAGAPMVLQVSENTVAYHGGLAPLGSACLAIAHASSAPVVVHLDHAESRALVSEAIALGFGSVMYDGSTLEVADNLAQTAQVVAEARARGVFVEAELGRIGGKDGAHAPGVRTDPDEAVRFVAETGVDALAVAVGSSHAMTDRVAALDLELVAQLRAALPVPLVLHGSSGVPDEELGRAIDAGMTKINVSTHLNKVMSAVVRDYLAAHPDTADPRQYLRPAREAMSAEAERLLHVVRAAA